MLAAALPGSLPAWLEKNPACLRLLGERVGGVSWGYGLDEVGSSNRTPLASASCFFCHLGYRRLSESSATTGFRLPSCSVFGLLNRFQRRFCLTTRGFTAPVWLVTVVPPCLSDAWRRLQFLAGSGQLAVRWCGSRFPVCSAAIAVTLVSPLWVAAVSSCRGLPRRLVLSFPTRRWLPGTIAVLRTRRTPRHDEKRKTTGLDLMSRVPRLCCFRSLGRFPPRCACVTLLLFAR